MLTIILMDYHQFKKNIKIKKYVNLTLKTCFSLTSKLTDPMLLEKTLNEFQFPFVSFDKMGFDENEEESNKKN